MFKKFRYREPFKDLVIQREGKAGRILDMARRFWKPRFEGQHTDRQTTDIGSTLDDGHSDAPAWVLRENERTCTDCLPLFMGKSDRREHAAVQ
jgi:hypothetical protein